MSDEKKIEDLIYSISSLINEAKQESKLLEQIDDRIDSYQLNKPKILIPNNPKSVDDGVEKSFEQSSKSKFYDWKKVNFLKKNFEKENKINLEKKVSEIFESEINLWIKLSLKNIIQSELNKFYNKIITEKLK